MTMTRSPTNTAAQPTYHRNCFRWVALGIQHLFASKGKFVHVFVLVMTKNRAGGQDSYFCVVFKSRSFETIRKSLFGYFRWMSRTVAEPPTSGPWASFSTPCLLEGGCFISSFSLLLDVLGFWPGCWNCEEVHPLWLMWMGLQVFIEVNTQKQQLIALCDHEENPSSCLRARTCEFSATTVLCFVGIRSTTWSRAHCSVRSVWVSTTCRTACPRAPSVWSAACCAVTRANVSAPPRCYNTPG